MRTKFILFFVLIVALLNCSPKSEISVQSELQEQKEAKDTTESPEEKISEEKEIITITKNDILKILVRADYAPYMSLNKNNELEGFWVDIERAIMNEMKQKYEMIPWTDVAKAGQDLKVGIAHMATGAGLTPDYTKMFNMSNPVFKFDFITFVHNDTTDIGGNNPEEVIKSLFGKKVSAQARDPVYILLRDYREIEIVECKSGTEALELLANKVVDASQDDLTIGLYHARIKNWPIKPIGVPILSYEFAAAFYKGINTEIIARYNNALNTIKLNGTYDIIFNTWFPKK